MQSWCKIFHHYPGIPIRHHILGGGSSGENGGYNITYVNTPCPCSPIEQTSALTYEVPYKNFNPKNKDGMPFGSYFLQRIVYDYCIPSYVASCPSGASIGGQMAAINAAAIYATMATPAESRLDARINSFMITGAGTLANQVQGDVAIGSTEFDHSAKDEHTPGAYFNFDFDGDGRIDTSVLGEKDWQKDKLFVYLGGKPYKQDPETDLYIDYDLQREGDYLPDLVPRDLLKTVSYEDLEETDLYIFRAATGELITERVRLKPEESFGLENGGIDDDASTPDFFYRALMRGPTVNEQRLVGRELDKWHSAADINLAYLGGSRLDALMPGELVTLVVINRPTGYIGTGHAERGVLP